MNKITALILILLFAGFTRQTTASQIQSASSIQEAIHHYIASNLALDTDYKVRLGQLDNRLKLPYCTEPLDIFTHSSSIKPGRNSVGIKCKGTQKWTIYSSAIVTVFKEVIVLTQPIRRGDIFSLNNLHFEKRDISTIRAGFLTDPLAVVNKQATRNLGLGSVINKSNYTEPKLIKRGEKVYIKASSPYLDISVMGIAMMDGIKGQNIRVKNEKSHKIIQATVVRPGQVLVMF
ncbi:MAG: flagellar basal body P-ring formation protein FlgA [Methylococcales bacterium]|nr:flagellar basal body P-ring formation protein FlgA [Methylococcales bacterium]